MTFSDRYKFVLIALGNSGRGSGAVDQGSPAQELSTYPLYQFWVSPVLDPPLLAVILLAPCSFSCYLAPGPTLLPSQSGSHSWSHSLSRILCLVVILIIPVPYSLSCSRSHIPSPHAGPAFPFPYFLSHFRISIPSPISNPGPIFLIPIPYSLSSCCICIPCPVPTFPFPVRVLYSPSQSCILVSVPGSRSHSLSPFPVPSHQAPPPSLRPPRGPHVTRENPALLPPTNHSARSLLDLHNHAFGPDPAHRRLKPRPGAVYSQFRPSAPSKSGPSTESAPNSFRVLSGSLRVLPVLVPALCRARPLWNPPGQSTAAFQCRHRPGPGWERRRGRKERGAGRTRRGKSGT
ncbi:uncharacterized protein LOC134057542 [Cinclus cinclus]|uniref:uncharacterized protein LOC134054817 n=1 Tax=Cinclus cinclus TaxID=127875 RepID=UPI002E113B71